MRYLKLILIVLIAGAALIWACRKNSLQSETTLNFVPIPEVSIADPTNQYQQTSFEGWVEIGSTHSESIINITDISISSRDDKRNRVIVLQQASAQSTFSGSIEKKEADILYFKRGVIIALKDGSGNYLFVLGEDKPDELAQTFLQAINKSFEITKSFYGYGLAVMIRDIGKLKDYLIPRTLTFYNTDEELKALGIVDSRDMPPSCSDCSNMLRCTCGGFGTLSCSCGETSVSCASGCNACCNSTSAKCCSPETTPD